MRSLCTRHEVREKRRRRSEVGGWRVGGKRVFVLEGRGGTHGKEERGGRERRRKGGGAVQEGS
eukprot:745674-Hanusia_phi.AAC.3